MESVKEELVPVLQEVISSGSLTPLTTSSAASLITESLSSSRVVQQSAWLWTDQTTLWLISAGLGGAAVGFFFGFRIGIVSGRAKKYISSKQFMRAAALNSYDGVSAVSLQNVEVPSIVKESEVQIEVRAASLDPVDLKVANGFGRGLRDLVNRYNPNVSTNNFPVTLGRDGTGVVSQVGSEVHNLKVGDRVWFVVPYCVQGSLANFLVLDRDFVRLLPASVSFEGGATLPYSGMVAWDMLVTCGGLGPRTQSRDKTVFIWGGVRALERLSVQLCAIWGARVTCVAPRYTHEFLLALGAHEVIEDEMTEVDKILRSGKRFDVVMNTGSVLSEALCLALASPSHGRVVSSLVQPPGFKEYGLLSGIVSGVFISIWNILRYNLIGVEQDWKTTRLDGDVLDYLGKLVTEGKLDPIGERIYPLDQVELAFKSLAAGGHKGKLVVRMTPEQQDPAEQAALVFRG